MSPIATVIIVEPRMQGYFGCLKTFISIEATQLPPAYKMKIDKMTG